MKKENGLLFGAILAPLLLIGYFLVKPLFNAQTVEDPRYDVLLSARNYAVPAPDGVHRYSFEVNNKHLSLWAHKTTPDRHRSTDSLHLFRFNVKTKKLVPLEFDPLAIKKKLKTSSWVVNIPELDAYVLTSKKKSPDDFVWVV
mgnify:CR=1 FL=1